MIVVSPRVGALRGEAPIVLALTALLTIVSLVPPGRAATAAGVTAFAYVGLNVASALHPQTLLRYEINREPLPVVHGGALRLVTTVK